MLFDEHLTNGRPLKSLPCTPDDQWETVRVIRFRPGQRLTESKFRLLEDIATRALNLRGVANHDRLRDWGHESERLVRAFLPTDEIVRLVTTPRFLTVETGQTIMPAVVHAECDAASELWQREIDDLRTLRMEWQQDAALVAVDTNVFLHHRLEPSEIDWQATLRLPSLGSLRVAIPMVVIDEIDNNKRNTKPEVRTRARLSGRFLAQAFGGTGEPGPYVLQRETNMRGSVTLAILPDSLLGHIRLARADDEIVQRLVELSDLTNRTIRILSFDNGMCFRARLAGLEAVQLGEEDERQLDKSPILGDRSRQKDVPTKGS